MNTYWQGGVIVGALILLILLLWKEAGRQNRSWLWVRLVATVVAVVSLVLLAIPIKYNHSQTPGDSRVAILLTPGYNEDSVTRFIAAQTDKPAVYHQQGNGVMPLFKSNVLTAGLEMLRKQQYTVLHIFGEGLTDIELARLGGLTIVFHAGEALPGVQSISWTGTVYAGEMLRVQGQYRNNNGEAVKLVLTAFDTPVDSVIVAPNNTANFSLATVPQQQGNATFQLVSLAGKDTVAAEPVPVQVLPVKTISVLMLASSPDFDTKFLKNQLAQNGYPVVVRTTISKNKYATEFLNHEVTGLQTITEKLLDQFDVVVADATELEALPSSQLLAIQNRVAEKGLGLLVKTDSVFGAKSFYNRPFSLLQTNAPAPATTLMLADSSLVLPELPMSKLLTLTNKPGILPLAMSSRGEIVAGFGLFSQGKLAVTTISNSWQWLLAGNGKAYQQYWTYLLQKISRQTPLQRTVVVADRFATVHLPVTIQVNDTATVKDIVVDSNAIAMAQHPMLPFVYSGTVWPRGNGWLNILAGNEVMAPRYIFAANDYVAVRSVAKTSQTKLYEQQSQKYSTGKQPGGVSTKPIPLWWMMASFLLAVTFLWVEKKFL